MEFIAADVSVLARVPANEPILALMRRWASPQGPNAVPPWAVGRYTVPTHPDLVLQLGAVAAALGREVRFVFGVPSLIGDGGRLDTFVRGTNDLSLRIGEPVGSGEGASGQAIAGLVADLEARGGRPRNDDAPGWWKVDAWRLGVPNDEAVPLLARWCAIVLAAPDPAHA
jgi:hypothetical protein